MTLTRPTIYIAGVARSGTSWIGQILNSSSEVRFRFQPFFAYEFKNRVSEDSSRSDYRKLLTDVYDSYCEFLLQQDKIDDGTYPKFKKTNESILVFKENRYQSYIEPMLRKLPELKLVGVIRHPCAVINSWSNNKKEFPAGSDLIKEWRFGNCKNKGNEDYFGYYKWKEIAHLYLDLKDKYPKQVAIVRYEELVQNTIKITKKLFKFLNIPYNKQTEAFLKDSTSRQQNSYYSVYKTQEVIHKWKSALNQTISDEIYADVKNTRLEQFIVSDQNL